MGSDRKGIEIKAGNQWNQIVTPRDSELENIIKVLKELEQRKIETYLNINNHYEGSAPLTIQKIQRLME
jgi:uncharacterized protein YecE (DUF72 family)